MSTEDSELVAGLDRDPQELEPVAMGRADAEPTFSMINARLGGSLQSKSQEGQVKEVLGMVLCHKFYC